MGEAVVASSTQVAPPVCQTPVLCAACPPPSWGALYVPVSPADRAPRGPTNGAHTPAQPSPGARRSRAQAAPCSCGWSSMPHARLDCRNTSHVHTTIYQWHDPLGTRMLRSGHAAAAAAPLWGAQGHGKG